MSIEVSGCGTFSSTSGMPEANSAQGAEHWVFLGPRAPSLCAFSAPSSLRVFVSDLMSEVYPSSQKQKSGGSFYDLLGP